MKRNFYHSLYMFAGFMLILSCSNEGEYTLTETAPMDFKTYYNGLTVTFVNTSENASAISWNFGDNTPEVTGDSVLHTYASPGKFVINMNGTVENKVYQFNTVLGVDKASVVSLTDDSFEDWDLVTYPDFQLEGKDHVIGGKVDYDANYIYIYLEYDTAGTNGLAPLEEAIMDLYMDVDNNILTGFSSSIGADYLFEGNIQTGWFDYYSYQNEDQGNWDYWVYFTMDDAILPGYSEEAENSVKMEFALSREKFKITKDVFGFQLTLNYSDWSGEAGSLAKDNETKIMVKMDKQ
jgi:PKD repeat protein